MSIKSCKKSKRDEAIFTIAKERIDTHSVEEFKKKQEENKQKEIKKKLKEYKKFIEKTTTSGIVF